MKAKRQMKAERQINAEKQMKAERQMKAEKGVIAISTDNIDLMAKDLRIFLI